MHKESDQDYINLVLNGDVNTFAMLIDRYKDLIFTLSLKMLVDSQEAEEAAQDTFIKAYRSLERYKGDAKFSTWLYKIAYNNCLDRLKKKKRTAHIINIEVSEFEMKSLSSALDTIEQNERRTVIDECLKMMTPDESFLLTLYYLQERSLKEISGIMNINENNLKIKLFRSRKKLAGILRYKLEPETISMYEK